MRPRPAHNGDALYDLTKHRDSPAAHRSGPAGMLQQNTVKAPTTQGRNQSGETFNLQYGYLSYNPMYISHEKLNHALSSPAKEEALRTARPGPGPATVPLDAADDAPGKPTSVIVEHRTPRHQPAPITVDPYRCRGSITHGTAAGVKPISAATTMRQSGVSAAQPLTTRDELTSWSKKPTCVVNGLCWTGSQTIPSAARPVSPPNKVDLISQGLVPNPLYSSAAVGAHRGVAEVLPKPAVAGVDYAVDMSAKRTAVTRCEAPPKRSRCEDPLPTQWPPQSQSQGQGPPTGSSYIDSFKSFVDHAVQSAFMDDAEKEATARSAPPNAAADGQTADDHVRHITMGSILRSLNASPKSQSRNLPPKTGYLSASQSDPTLGVAGTEPGVRDGGAALIYEKLAISTSVQPLSSPAQMPSLAAPTMLTSTSPAAVNNGPPLLIPQCPIESVDDNPSVANSPALSTAAGSDKVPFRGGGGDTDSDTLSAHSPAPVLVPAETTPPPTNAASSSLHLKKTWLLRYSDEDRKNTTTGCDSSAGSRSSDSYEKSQDCADVDEKPSSTDVWSLKQKQNSENISEDSMSAVDAKQPKASSEKQRPDADKKGSSKSSLGNCREAEDGKVADGKDSIKNCFINCTYLSGDQDARSLRRVTKDSGLEDKDAQSSTSKESDDSQVLLV